MVLAGLVAAAAILVYSGLPARFTAFAAPSPSFQSEVAHTQPLTAGNLNETIRLSGTIVAERLQMIQAPQLLGIRGVGTTVGNVSTTSSPTSAPSFTPANDTALGGTSNRFSDRQAPTRLPRLLTRRLPPPGRSTTAWPPR